MSTRTRRKTRETHAGPYYRIDPFRAWLQHQLERHARLYDMNQADFCKRIGVSERRLHRWMTETVTISLRSVDEVVTRFGSPELLNELCPVGSEVSRIMRHQQAAA